MMTGAPTGDQPVISISHSCLFELLRAGSEQQWESWTMMVMESGEKSPGPGCSEWLFLMEDTKVKVNLCVCVCVCV